MITQFNRTDIPKILDKEIGFFNEQSLVASHMRVIYVAMGWTHMLTETYKIDELVEELTEWCLRALDDDKELLEHSVASGGLLVTAYIDSEGFINVDYSFRII
jgi:predicted histidine transporter YuiF (NhaC family)